MSENRIFLDRRGAIVTGGASGIGFSIVKRLTNSGANVSILDLDQKTIEIAVDQIDNPAVSGLKCNVSDVRSVESAINSSKEIIKQLSLDLFFGQL